MISAITNTDSSSPHSQLAARFGMEFVDLEQFIVDADLLQTFPGQDLFREKILPLQRVGNRVQVAVADPLNLEALQDLTRCRPPQVTKSAMRPRPPQSSNW